MDQRETRNSNGNKKTLFELSWGRWRSNIPQVRDTIDLTLSRGKKEKRSEDVRTFHLEKSSGVFSKAPRYIKLRLKHAWKMKSILMHMTTITLCMLITTGCPRVNGQIEIAIRLYLQGVPELMGFLKHVLRPLCGISVTSPIHHWKALSPPFWIMVKDFVKNHPWRAKSSNKVKLKIWIWIVKFLNCGGVIIFPIFNQFLWL